MLQKDQVAETKRYAIRRLFWATVWFAIVLVCLKAYYLGIPGSRALTDVEGYLRSLAAISYVDVVFAAALWVFGRMLLAVARNRLAIGTVSVTFVALGAFCCVYALANIIIFGVFG